MRSLFLLIVFFTYCADLKAQQPGVYAKKGKDFTYRLELRSDSTFELTKQYFEGRALCTGTWKMYGRDSIKLQCGEVTLAEKLSSGYINDRTEYIKVRGRKTLILGKVRMTRLS